MESVAELRKEYDEKINTYICLKEEVLFVLSRELEDNNVPMHQRTGRVKGWDSFIDKVQQNKHENPFDDITDICAVRIICLFRSDIERICEIIERFFIVKEKDDKLFKSEALFGYMSIHYVCSFPDSYQGPRYDEIKGLVFEIQVRTIAMHAWATISHYLLYKSPLAVPSNLRKDFNALSAIFYLADSNFEALFKASQKAREVATEKAKNTNLIGKEEIDYETLYAYIRRRFPTKSHSGPNSLSNLVEELRVAGYTKIEQVDKMLNKSEKSFRKYVQMEGTDYNRYYDLAVVRLSLGIVDEKFLKASQKNEASCKLLRTYRNEE